jgi:hypothetical protein
VGNAATGVLAGMLAWRLRRELPDDTRWVATGAALAGAALTVAGSSLVLSGTTGFLLAGLISSVGFAGIGAWLLAVSRTAGRTRDWPRRLRRAGGIAGALMAFGILSAPGMVLRFDDMATAPAWVWIGFVGWLGTYVAYPAWAIWLGMAESRLGRRDRALAGARNTDGSLSSIGT